MKNQRGFSVLEVIMSVGFLAGLVVVCTHIFKKQQAEMINAIQDIEITTTINEVRMALRSREACSASFENKKVGSRDIKVIKKVIQYPETDEIEEIEAFPLYQYGRISFGDYQLKISSYTLEAAAGNSDTDGETELNLVMGFDKNLPDLKEKNNPLRKIKIYASLDGLGRIESCGLSRETQSNEKFTIIDGEHIREIGRVGIGTKKLSNRLTLDKGIQFLPTNNLFCSIEINGAIFYHKAFQALAICYNNHAYKLSNLGLKF